MAREVKTGSTKIEFVLSASLKNKWLRKLKKENCSMAQRLRDLVQGDLKNVISKYD